jgi:hypothetical protein
MYARAKKKFKRDREDDDNPVVQPEVEPCTREGCTAQSAAKVVVTGTLLTLGIEGGRDRRTFVVDTGAMVSIIQPGISKAQMQPCDVKARGVTGTRLDILGEQDVEFTLRDSNNEDIKFRHVFIVSPLKR